MCKSCHCCSFDSLGCRLRTLKAMGAFLFLFGTIFALAGIAIGFLSDLYFELISLPDVFPEYILFAYLVISTGIVALGTGLVAIYIAKTMSDDDCSTRGLGILALLTIVCSLATVGVPAWPLYENGYFLEIPQQTSALNTTTPLPATTVPDVMSTMNMMLANSNTTAMNDTSMTTNGTVMNETTSMNMTSMNETTSMNMTSMNETTSMNMTSMNETTSMNMTSMDNNATGSSNSTSMDSANMTMTNVTGDNSTESISTPDSNNTVTSAPSMTTLDVTAGTTENFSGNSTESTVTRVPIDFDEWLVIMAPFGIISLFAFFFVLFGLFIFCIACCCPERSEIVDDIDLYKS